ncbi:hypothetical protein DYD21_08045 [Rhodohalobacter sp. SW132]|nr:hypothetical protein [Rhodohalobacter sp. SW132]REL37723.1 hypothetical protein DYD21_08045 [Rhodohalobacter sp. SW132]
MKVEKSRQKLDVVLQSDFNLNAVRRISELLNGRKELSIDLSNSRFVNSKAIIYLHHLMYAESPVDVQLRNPPKIFFELLKTLGLHKVWKLEEIVQP